MSRSTDPRPKSGRDTHDGGFTLLEVVVSLGLLMTVMVALLPQLVVGIKSTGTARFVSQAKGVAQGELERMRNLPFRIAPAAGDFIDVLDHYYRDTTSATTTPTCTTADGYVAPTTGWAGYVPAESSARCDYEPASGAFYRSVRVVAPSGGSGGFTVVTNTQFISGATPPQPVSPRNNYDTQVVGADNPPSAQVGVTVTVFYADRGTLRPVTTYTQISERLPATMRVHAESNVTAVEVGSVTTDKVPLSLSGGLLNLAGSLSHASTAHANLAAASAGLATGAQQSGASVTAAAPPLVSSPATLAPAGGLVSGSCDLACWGASRLGPVSVTAENALPGAGSPSAPLQAMITDSATNGGISFGNSAPDEYRPGLDLQAPLVRMDATAAPVPSGLSGCAPGGSGPSSYVTASGYLHTTAVDDTASVEACAVTRTTPISLLPTQFAPDGVVQIELRRASARCVVAGAGHAPTATHDYEAVVKYWNDGAYVVAATIVPGQTVDALASVPMDTPVSAGRVLGDYIASWSALTADKITQTQAVGAAEVTLPGVVNIATQPVRRDPAAADGLDAASAVSLTVGALGCSAKDAR